MIRPALAAVAAGAALFVPTTASAAPAAQVTVDLDCAAGGYVVTSSKHLSNIVVRSTAGTDERTVYEGQQLYTAVVDATDADVIWVKSGSTRSGDGSGYGQRFDVDPTDCGTPPDSDGDGVPDDQDCAPNDPAISPQAVDVPNNGIDENCDGHDLLVGDGEVRATLTWEGDDDLDVHVIDPSGERIWWQDRQSASGGVQDRDDNVAVCGTDQEPGGVENIFWAPNAAPNGTYTVEVFSWDDCPPAGSNWHLQVFVSDQVVIDRTGTTSGGTNGTQGAPSPDDKGVPLLSETFTLG